MSKNNKFKDLIKNKEVLIWGGIILAMIAVAVLQFVFK